MVAVWQYGCMEDKKDSKTTLRLDRSLHKRFRFLAVDRDTTFTALVTEALEQYLAREEGKRRRTKT